MKWYIYKLLGIFKHCKNHLYSVSFKMCLITKIFAHQLESTIIVIWAAYIKLVAYHHFVKGFEVCLESVHKRISVFNLRRFVYNIRRFI